MLITKKDGSKRFCIDYRALNKVTKKGAFPYLVLMNLWICYRNKVVLFIRPGFGLLASGSVAEGIG
jgi:hypothetical protein